MHFTPQLTYLRYFYEMPLFKTISPGVVRNLWTNDCKYMKQGPGVILSSHGGHFRSTRVQLVRGFDLIYLFSLIVSTRAIGVPDSWWEVLV